MIFQSKTILITGAGSGIGKDVAFALAKRGHRVIATTETAEQLSALNKEADQKGISIESHKIDITIPGDRDASMKYMPVDVLINNAAIGESGSLAEIDINIVRHTFEVNVFAPFELTQKVISTMIDQGSGTIIFVSSTAGRIVVPFLAPYSMTKFSLSSGVEALRKEMQVLNKNIHVCLVEPGAYHTGFNQKMFMSQFLRMKTTSYFYSKQKEIQDRLEYMFRLLEVRSTQSIVKTIVRATEAEKPRLRYTAPRWQALGVRILRILGK
ncbi:MAG: SDR family NAD(P)-dependent oxidoreductase [Candidatus Andersenbacteria bacterium]